MASRPVQCPINGLGVSGACGGGYYQVTTISGAIRALEMDAPEGLDACKIRGSPDPVLLRFEVFGYFFPVR